MSSRKDFLKVLGLSAFSPFFNNAVAGLARPQVTVKPKRLKNGDTVGIVSPAAPVYGKEKIEIMQESMEALGFNVEISNHVTAQWGYFAGEDKLRADEVNKMFADPNIDGIVCARGGWGCSRILPYLDYEMIAQNPKVIIGYSDVTSLLLALYAKTGLVTFHGPVGTSEWKDFSVNYFKSILMEGGKVEMTNPQKVEDTLTQIDDRVTTIRKGTAQGPLLGGNLTVLTTIIGSDFLPEWDDAILFLEDVNEGIYRVDRMLTQMKLAGILDQLNGFVFGKCTECGPGSGYGSFTMDQVFDHHIEPLNIPAWSGAMIGHISEKFTVPIGIQARIDAAKGTIKMLEPAVQ
jgi:muramoyltetrapeptide carboxypeptidase